MGLYATPHLRFPVLRDPVTRKLQTVDQGTADHIMSCEQFIVACPQGHRDERPEFGWVFPTFKTAPLNVAPLVTALRTFEPRGQASGEEYADAANAAYRHMAITIGVQDG